MINDLMKFLNAGGAGAAGAGIDFGKVAEAAPGVGNVSFGAGMPEFGLNNSIDAAGDAGAMQMADFSPAGGIPDTPLAQAEAGIAPTGGGFNYKGMLESLGKNLGEQAKANKPTISPVDTSARGAGQASAPIMLPTGMGQGQSGAMQAIQGMIGGQPSREQLMKMMMGA